MSSVYPGVRPGQGERAQNLLEAVEWAQRGAERASERGTFCVGGVLLGPAYELLAESSNHVLCNGAVCDPTAHGERQLVDWYFDQSGLPPAESCTIVSTLDPCMMCTGALLYGGFRVVTLALDPDAGVNANGDCRFETLPPDLRPDARERFAYLGVEGVRPAFGCDVSVSADLERRSYELFRQSLSRVQSVIHGRPTGALPCQAWNEEEAALLNDGQPVAVASSRGHTRTALMELARSQPFLGRTLIQRRGPDLSPLSIMELGAYGSCMEGPARGSWLYQNPGCPPEQLTRQLERMPRFYREVVGIRIQSAGAGSD